MFRTKGLQGACSEQYRVNKSAAIHRDAIKKLEKKKTVLRRELKSVDSSLKYRNSILAEREEELMYIEADINRMYKIEESLIGGG